MAALTTLMRRADARAGEAARTVFVAGATGATGREVVRQALAAGYTVRAGARDASSVERLPGVTPVAFDVVEDSDQQLVDAVGGASAVVCVIGVHVTTGTGAGAASRGSPRRASAHLVDNVGTCRLVDAALAWGTTEQFVLVSALLTNAPAMGQAMNGSYLALEALGNVLSEKHEAELYLRSRASKNSDMAYTIVRPGALASKGGLVDDAALADRGLGVRLGAEDTLFELRPRLAVPRAAVAALCVEALGDARSRGRLVEMVGEEGMLPLEQVGNPWAVAEAAVA